MPTSSRGGVTLPPNPISGHITGAAAVNGRLPDSPVAAHLDPTAAPAPTAPRHTLPAGGLEQLNAETQAASAPAVADFNRRAGTTYHDIPAGWKPEDIRTIHEQAAKNPDVASFWGGLVNPIDWGVQGVKGARQAAHGVGELAHGKLARGALDVGLGGLSAAAVLPVGRGARALREGLAAEKAVTRALKAGRFNAVRDIAEQTAPTGEQATRAALAAFKAMPHEVFRQIGVTPEEFARHLVAGARMRYWYEESAHGILQMAGGNRNLADKYAQVTAIMSAQKEPLPNIQLANRAIHEFQTTGRVLSGDVHQAAKATAVLRGEKWNGVKTDRFYKNMLEEINPRKYKRLFGNGEVTNDIWMARLYGLKSDVPTPREYEAMTKATQAAAEELGWKPKQVQAAQWISKKAESEPRAAAGGASTFADALALEHARVPFEAAPGAEAAPELHAKYQALGQQQREAYTAAKADLVRQYLRDAEVMGRMGGSGPGVFEGQISPGRAVDIAASRARSPHGKADLNAASPEERAAMHEANRVAARTVHPETRAALDYHAAAIGHALNQDAAVWHKPFFVNVAKKDANGVRLELGRTISADQARALDAAFRAEGLDIAIVHHPNGADLLNVGEIPNAKFHAAVADAADKAGIDGSAVPFAYDGNYIDRSAYADHLEGALGRGSESNGGGGADPGVLEGRRADALSRLRAGSDAVDRRFLGGGGLGARLADERGSVDLGAFFPQAVRSREEAHAHLLDAAAQARAEGFTGEPGGKGHPPLVDKGVADEATGGELGQRIREALQHAPSVRKAQKEMQSLDRTDRVRAAAEAERNAGGGMTGYAAAGRHLAGEYDKEFFGHLKDFTQEQLHEAAKVIDRAPMQFFEKRHAKAALKAMVEDGAVPTKGDHALLERAFGRVTGTAAPEEKLATFWDKFVGAINIPRALRSSGDISAGFRQGLVVLVTHPRVFARQFAKQIRSFGSEEYYNAQEAWIQNHPYYPLALKYRLPLTMLDAPFAGQEEAFVGSRMAEKLNLREIPGPLKGKKYASGPGDIVRASDRAFTGFQNGTRMETFALMLEKAAGLGHDFTSNNPEADHLGESIARVVGTFTGRGSAPEKLDKFLPALNVLMFSPRLMASRLNLMSPAYYASLDPFARREAMAGARNLVAAIGTTMFVAKLLGAQVDLDPRSSNFTKIKIGNTRIDIAGGFSQYVRFIAQEMTREAISSSGHRSHIGWGQHDISDLANTTKLARSKAAPIPGLLWDEGSGKDFIGRPVKQGHELFGNAPFVSQDVVDAYQQSGTKTAVIAGFLSAIGLGVQSYKDKPAPSGGGGGGSGFDGGSGSFGDGGGFGDNSGGFGGGGGGFGG